MQPYMYMFVEATNLKPRGNFPSICSGWYTCREMYTCICSCDDLDLAKFMYSDINGVCVCVCIALPFNVVLILCLVVIFVEN